MPKRVSDELRLRVVRAIDDGMFRRRAAARFDIAPSTAIRWHEEWRHRLHLGSVARLRATRIHAKKTGHAAEQAYAPVSAILSTVFGLIYAAIAVAGFLKDDRLPHT